MQQTKYLTLAGSTLAVVSSSLLYVNVALQMMAPSSEEGSIFWTSPWLNLFVFGNNFDSMANDVGMLLICGVLKKVPQAVASSRKLTSSKNDDSSVYPATP